MERLKDLITPGDYSIEFISTAGNFFIMRNGLTVSIDPNFPEGKEILMRLNYVPDMLELIEKQHIAIEAAFNHPLWEGRKEVLKSALESYNKIFNK